MLLMVVMHGGVATEISLPCILASGGHLCNVYGSVVAGYC